MQVTANNPSVRKLAACARADRSVCIDIRYVPVNENGKLENLSPSLTVECALCETSLDGRTDWEPFLQGIDDVSKEYAFHGCTSREIDHTRVCFPCLDMIYSTEAD